VWRWDQGEPFGNNPADVDPDANSVAFDLPLRLPGQRYDAETGLHYNYFRDYDPSLGRYGESDPIGLQGGLNTYAYVGGSPVLRSDERGLDYPAMYPMTETFMKYPQGLPCGCPSKSDKSKTVGKAIGGATLGGAAIGGLAGLGLGIAATAGELAGAVGLVGGAGAAAVGAKGAVAGIVIGGGAGACVGLVIGGMIYFAPSMCAPCPETYEPDVWL
jgi:RHS repeat-associated protein